MLVTHLDAEPVLHVARCARVAATELATATRETKDAALLAIADALESRAAEVLDANADDIARASANGATDAYLDRLRLTEARIASMAGDVRKTATLPDPVGDLAITSRPAIASPITALWMAKGRAIPAADSELITARETPRSENDSVDMRDS